MTMNCGCCMIYVVVHILVLFLLLPSAESTARFTKVPPSKLYVVKGEIARFVWDYHVDDRDKEFHRTSPKWFFVDHQGFVKTIGLDFRNYNWTFVIDKRTCPPRLLSPTVRVSKESKATLVITNVTMADSGLYKCVLILLRGTVVISNVQLIVTDVMPHFIQVPPRILYVAIGQAAKFVWDYVAGNKTADFDLQSPRWEVYNSVNGWKTIGADHSTSGWQWKLNASCPARLQNPTRVSKASTASLVIYNVTTEDSGIYRCNLTIRHRPPVTSTSQLVVTVGPHFVSPPPSSKNITEGQHLKILCSATGPPTPNVTWVRVQGVSKVTVSNGVGNALLSISNITKERTGRNRRYECQAANNPNQGHVTTQTRIYVMYKPSIDHSKSDATVTSLPVATITLRCMFSGFPCPNATWYKPDEEPIKENVTSFCGLSEILLHIKDAQDYGKYKCRVENILGYSEHNITVIAYDLETNVNHNQQSRVTIAYGRDPVFIVSITINVVFFIIIVIMVFLNIKLRREASKTKKTYHDGIIKMAEMPVSSPTPISTNEASSSNQAVDDYDQPDVEAMTSSSSHVGANYPYDVPDIQFVDGTSTSTSQPSHYQELNTNNTTSRDYQSLMDARTAAVNPSCLQPELSNPYEPLRLKKESQYQQLNRH